MKTHFLLLSIILCFFLSITGCGGGSSSINPDPVSTVTATATFTPTFTPTPKFGSIEGKVFEADRTTGVSGAFVAFYSYTYPGYIVVQSLPNGTTTSDNNGYFRFDKVPQGACRVEGWRTEGDYKIEPNNPLGASNGDVEDGIATVNIITNIIAPTFTPTPTPTHTPTPTLTPTPTITLTPTQTNTPEPGIGIIISEK